MERKLYDLTTGQNIITYGMRSTKHHEIMNINIEFQFDSDMDRHILMQAVNMAALRNPNNQIRFTSKDKQLYQYFSEEAQEKIEYLEFDNDEAYNKYVKTTCETPFPHDGLEVQLYKLTVLKKPNGKLAILGVFAHYIYDTYSAVMTFKEIIDIYKALLNGQPLPPETISPIAAYEEEKKYIGSSKWERDKQFYTEMFAEEPQYTIISGKKSKTFRKNSKKGLRAAVINPSCSAGALVIPLERAFTDKINKYASEHRITAQNFYMLALRTYLSVVCEVDDVLFDCVTNRRTTITKRKAGGTLADSARFRTTFKNDISFKEAIDLTNRNVTEVYKHIDFGAQTIDGLIIMPKYNMQLIDEYGATLFTYQAPIVLDGEIKYSFRHIGNGREWSGCYVMIMPCNSDNDYVADYSWIKKVIDESDVRSFHEFMVKFINEGIDNDSQSLNDIIKKAGK